MEALIEYTVSQGLTVNIFWKFCQKVYEYQKMTKPAKIVFVADCGAVEQKPPQNLCLQVWAIQDTTRPQRETPADLAWADEG